MSEPFFKGVAAKLTGYKQIPVPYVNGSSTVGSRKGGSSSSRERVSLGDLK